MKNGDAAGETSTFPVRGEERDFVAIGEWIRGAERYFLQMFNDTGDLVGEGLTPPSREKLGACLAAVRPFVPSAALRGVSTD